MRSCDRRQILFCRFLPERLSTVQYVILLEVLMSLSFLFMSISNSILTSRYIHPNKHLIQLISNIYTPIIYTQDTAATIVTPQPAPTVETQPAALAPETKTAAMHEPSAPAPAAHSQTSSTTVPHSHSPMDSLPLLVPSNMQNSRPAGVPLAPPSSSPAPSCGWPALGRPPG